MPKFLKYDLMESEAPPELLISECSQGQGDSVFFVSRLYRFCLFD